MAWSAYNVEARFRFSSNAREELGKISMLADDVSISLGRAEAAVKSFSTTSRSLDSMAASFGRLGESAAQTTGRIDLALEGIDSNVTASAGRVTAATDAMALGFRNVAEAARGARAAVGSGISPGRSANRSANESMLTPATVGGVASLLTLGEGLHRASESQAALLRLQAQTGRSYADLFGTFMPISQAATNRTAMSPADALNITREVSGVIKDPNELRSALVGNRGGGGIIDLVSVLRRSGVAVDNPESIAKNIVTLDHILNAYTGPAMANVNDKLYRASVGSGMQLSPLVTQIGYFGEQYRLASGNRKTADDDILKLAELGYWGIGHGKWGSGFGQILRTINRPPAHAVPVLEQLGVLDSRGMPSRTTMDAQGEFTPLAMISEARRRAAPGTDLYRRLGPMGVYGGLLNAGFPANAARTFSEALSPKTAGFLSRLDAAQTKMPTLMQDEGILMSGLGAQTERLTGLFGNLASVLAGPLIAPLTQFLKGAGDAVAGTTGFLQAHPGVTGVASAALVGGAAVGAFKVLQMFGGVGTIFHGAVHEASRTLGLRGGIGVYGVGHGGGIAARGPLEFIGNAARDMLSFRGLRDAGGRVGGFAMRGMAGSGDMMLEQIAGGFARIGGVGRIAGDVLGMVTTHIGVLGEWVARMGSKAIPVVGEILLLIDTLKFLGAHAKDIGWIIGRVAKWIISDGLPMLLNAFKDMIMGVLTYIGQTFTGHGLFDTLRSFGSGLAAGFNADAPSKPGSSKTPDHHGMNGRHPAVATPQKTAMLMGGGTHIHGPIHVEYSGAHLEELLGEIHEHANSSHLPDSNPHHTHQQSGLPSETLYGTG